MPYCKPQILPRPHETGYSLTRKQVSLSSIPQSQLSPVHDPSGHRDVVSKTPNFLYCEHLPDPGLYSVYKTTIDTTGHSGSWLDKKDGGSGGVGTEATSGMYASISASSSAGTKSSGCSGIEVLSFDGSEPQPLLNSPSLDVSLGDVIGPEPPIKPHSLVIFDEKKLGIVMSADFAVTYTSVHSEARSWSIPSEDPYEEAAQQLLEQAPCYPEYVPDLIELEDHVPAHIPEHPEDLVPAEDKALIEAYIPEVDVRSRESSEFYSRHHDAQKDRAPVRAEIEGIRGTSCSVRDSGALPRVAALDCR
nr:hypothetical protein [Tanacetum cinerariifolium]